MLKIVLKSFIASIFCISLTSHAQNPHPSCAPNRYISEISSTVLSTKNVKFGNNTSVSGTMTNLYMDIYEPVGDVISARPLIILAHGGSFVSGTRDNIKEFCVFYAKHGFVTATIDYRLYDGSFSPENSIATGIDAVLKGVSDMKAAVRYFKEDASNTNVYKVDPKQIFVGGVSAGAIIANHVGYLDSSDIISSELASAISNNGGFNGNSSPNIQYSSAVNGVINFSGAILDSNLIDSDNPPLFSTHVDNDPIVPINTGYLSFFNFNVIEADGSKVMHSRANEFTLFNELHILTGSSHTEYLDTPSSRAEFLLLSSIFLNHLLCPQTLGNLNNKRLNRIRLFPNPTRNSFIISDKIDHILNLSVYDIQGNLIFVQPRFKTNHDKINLNLPSGIYFIHLSNGEFSKILKLAKY